MDDQHSTILPKLSKHWSESQTQECVFKKCCKKYKKKEKKRCGSCPKR